VDDYQRFESVALTDELPDRSILDSAASNLTRLVKSGRQEVELYAKLSWELNDAHKVISGFNIQNNETERESYGASYISSQTQSTRNNDEKTTETALYLVYEAILTKSLSLNIGNRYESFDYDMTGEGETRFSESDIAITPPADFQGKFSINTPSAHLKWSGENQDVTLSAHRAITVPTLSQLSEFNVSTSTRRPEIFIGNPNLDPETVNTVNLSYDYHLEKGNGILGLSIYTKKSKNLIDTLEITSLPENIAFATGGRVISTYINSDNEIENMGLEVDFSLPLLDTLNLSSNITYLETDADIVGTPKEDSTTANLTLDHNIGTWTYGVSYSYRSEDTQFTETQTPFFADPNYAPNQEPTPWIFKSVTKRDPSIDIFIEKRLSDVLLIRFSAENVGDAEYSIEDESWIQGYEETIVSRYQESRKNEPTYMLNVRGSF
jgi:outer membrane receptor protein involved in Fe transport